MDEETLKKFYLEEIKIVQDIIRRIASNSFVMKGWAITLVTATLVIKISVEQKYAIFIALIPLISFWYLDAFFLRQERLFRKLYEWIITNRLTDKTSQRKYFDMSTKQFIKEIESTFRIMFSKTILWFYFPNLIIIVVFFFVFLWLK
jgi:hypothetical protein